MPRKTSVVRDGTRPKCLAAVVTGDSPDGTSSRAVVVRHLNVKVRVDIVYASLYFVLLCRTEVVAMAGAQFAGAAAHG